AILATPIICALSLSAIKSLAKETSETARALGADTGQVVITIIKQGRFAFLSAVIMGFSRVIGETGMTLMVGGNIKGFTRVMTTTIALETTKGNFETGIALGIVLFFVAVIINVFFQLLQGE
ncbi:MAG: ABC transporter permease, partial [Proteobacteria bacterium]|nr:ABC transporter permease [Pseudomonadota bacterium]